MRKKQKTNENKIWKTLFVYLDLYLEYPCATSIFYTPISYLTITITGADEIIFVGVEV